MAIARNCYFGRLPIGLPDFRVDDPCRATDIRTKQLSGRRAVDGPAPVERAQSM
jgi:hypothetical protein